MRKYFRNLWPTWQQYRQWSMPDKLTFIGTCVGILSLFITIATIDAYVLLITIAIMVVTLLIKITTDKPLIQGKWDKEKANEIVLNLMNQHSNPKEHDLISRRIIDHYTLNYMDKTSIIVVGYLSHDSCHACAPELSFVEFIKVRNGWNLKEAYINAFQDGSWGEPPSSIKLLAVGHDIFGVVIEHGYTAQGYLEEYTSIHAVVAGEFREIFSEITGVDDSGIGSPSKDSWNSLITFRQQGTSFYDMVVQQTGKKDGQPLRNKIVYKFDGRKYSSSNIYQ